MELRDRPEQSASIDLTARSVASEAIHLALCAFLSHSLAQNPVGGGMLYLLFICSRVALSMFINSRQNRKLRVLMLALTLAFAAYLAVVCAYTQGPLLLLGGFVMLRSSVSDLFLMIMPGRVPVRLWASVFLQAVFTGVFILLLAGYLTGAPLIACCVFFVLAGALLCLPRYALLSRAAISLRAPEDAFSYSVFMSMVLFFNIASNIGVIIFVAYLSFSLYAGGYTLYLILGAFFIAMVGLYLLAMRVVRVLGETMRLGLFILGALMWCFAYYMFVTQEGFGVLTLVWAGMWAFGSAAPRSVADLMLGDFELMSELTEQAFSAKELRRNNIVLQAIAFVLSVLIAAVTLGLERMLLPVEPEYTITPAFRFFMAFIPILLMLIACGFALRQPLDRFNRQRLLNFARGRMKSGPIRERLRALLVYKYRVRFGVKIIMAVLRPILRNKVYGQQHIDRTRFPSVFVCNHGYIYGPMAAVIYLPAYFRPWIDERMVDKALVADQILLGFKLPLPQRLKRALCAIVSIPACWALNSFEPIVVSRQSLRGVMKTLHDTVDAMTAGDNVLIFPENPALTENEYTHGKLGEFFTGFTQIGKLYYDKTGEKPLFYPVYANKKAHTLRIGAPVEFSPEAPAKEERERISSALHEAMSALSKMDE